jgi:integrase
MFTINFQARPNPRDSKMAKIDMILYCSGFNRVSKVLPISGPLKDWDEKTQSFKPRSTEYADKNKILFETKNKYLEVAEQWEKDGIAWSPIQWSHCFEKTGKKQKEETKVMTISKAMDLIMEDMNNRKRLKNGKFISSSSTARNYHFLKNSLENFTKEKYGRSFATFFFSDITEKFVEDYVVYLQERGIKNGNKGSVPEKLGRFYGVFYYADKMKIAGIDFSVFESRRELMKKNKKITPKTLPISVIKKIENIDRTLFSRIENFYIDLFLFSYYTGGMANIDVAYLTWDCIKDNVIQYERIKFPKEAKVPFIDKAKAIADKYKDKCYGNYVLPVFTYKHNTEAKQRGRLKRLYDKMSLTLQKVKKVIRYDGKITWYAARGTFITRMLDSGYHPTEVAQFAGNSPQTIYTNYWKNTNLQDTLKNMNRIV